MLRSASYSLGVHMQTPAAKTIGRKANWTALMLSVLLLVVSLHRAEAGVNVWTTNGPHSETINALAIDPQTPTTLYAGTSGHGVFKSTDGGGNWSAVNTGLTTPYGAIWVNALAIDPQTPTTLYAGKWTTYYGPHVGGVYKSTDGGTRWNATGLSNLPGGIGFTSAQANDPQTPPTLYATRGSYVRSLLIAGVLQSAGGRGSRGASKRRPPH